MSRCFVLVLVYVYIVEFNKFLKFYCGYNCVKCYYNYYN